MKCPKTPDLVKLNRNPNGVYERTIGKTKGGLRRFRFNADETTAKMECWKIWLRWDSRPQGVEFWEDLDKAERDKKTLEGYQNMTSPEWQAAYDAAQKAAEEKHRAELDAAAKARWTEKPNGQQMTIQAAKDAWLGMQKKRIGLIGSLGLTEATYEIIAYRINRALEFLPSNISRMDELTYANLETLVYTLAARPQLKVNPLASKEVQKVQRKQNMSQSTALSLINSVNQFLAWCVEDETVAFTLPRHSKKLFRIRPEAEEQSLRTVTPDELRTLWQGCINKNAHGKSAKRSGKRRQLFLLLGLNCGFYGCDISTLTDEMIKTEGENAYLWKLRRKTRKTNSKLARTKWLLWKETAALLREFMPLDVTPNNVRLAWRRLTEATGVNVSHSNLRDTGAQFMENFGGKELADTYLAHARGGVADSYSHPSWQRLSDALTAFHAAFIVPMLSDASQPQTAPKPQKRQQGRQRLPNASGEPSKVAA